jgi:host factor-I protein
MQSFFERRPLSLDTDQPSTRHIQELIRQQVPVVIQVSGGQQLEGRIQWQDVDYLALNCGEGLPLTLIQRHSASLIRALS